MGQNGFLMNTKEEIFLELSRINKLDNNFSLIINELLFCFEKFTDQVKFTNFQLTKNYLSLMLERDESNSLQIDLKDDYIQLQLLDNCELFIYFADDFVLSQ